MDLGREVELERVVGQVLEHGDVLVVTAHTDPGHGTVTIGADGNVWFTSDTHALGQITPAGVVTMFPNAAIGDPHGIVVDTHVRPLYENAVALFDRLAARHDAVELNVIVAPGEAPRAANARRASPAAATLDVVDEAKVPAAYWKPQPSKLDKQGLLTALKSGVAIEGVAIAAAQTQLSVRTR